MSNCCSRSPICAASRDSSRSRSVMGASALNSLTMGPPRAGGSLKSNSPSSRSAIAVRCCPSASNRVILASNSARLPVMARSCGSDSPPSETACCDPSRDVSGASSLKRGPFCCPTRYPDAARLSGKPRQQRDNSARDQRLSSIERERLCLELIRIIFMYWLTDIENVKYAQNYAIDGAKTPSQRCYLQSGEQHRDCEKTVIPFSGLRSTRGMARYHRLTRG